MGPRLAEGDHNLALWDFHDLLFQTIARKVEHANPLGGLYPYAGVVAPLPSGAATMARKKNQYAQVLRRAFEDNLTGCKSPA